MSPITCAALLFLGYFAVGELMLRACNWFWPHLLGLRDPGAPRLELLMLWPIAIALVLSFAIPDMISCWRRSFSFWRARRRHRRAQRAAIPACRTVQKIHSPFVVRAVFIVHAAAEIPLISALEIITVVVIFVAVGPGPLFYVVNILAFLMELAWMASLLWRSRGGEK